MKKMRFWFLVCCLSAWAGGMLAQNPLITDQFTADPTARVFGDRIYVYPSHDINCGTTWFCMKDYHVFSSENLTDWTDHGMIVTQEKVAWVDSTKNSMWAPDCYERNGKYYFYFPSIANAASGVRGMTVGVAVSDTPYGPFVPEQQPIKGVSGIDPNVFVDKDGQAYLYWAGMGALRGARLNENMLELDSEPQAIDSLPKGMKEGPFVFERKGIYYFTFPHVIEKTEALVYAMGDNPLGPFKYTGIIMDEDTLCWTNHHSILEFEGQWFLFYHYNDLSPRFDKNRSIRADSLFFNADGTIRKVTPTLRGVGLTQASGKIQIDRYSSICDTGASVAFMDTSDTFAGWKTILSVKEAWIKYNGVDFGERKMKTLIVRALSETGGTLEIHIGKPGAFISAKVKIPASGNWQEVKAKVKKIPQGIQDVGLILRDSGPVEIDWIRFE
ncbi:family 43 glycosylhydrolase [bacterium]|nr:family 43 glycosylhydrolase [bacterium]